MKRLCIFDFDGTTANTLYSIADFGNRALEAHGLRPLETDLYRQMVGNGAAVLLKGKRDEYIRRLNQLKEQSGDEEIFQGLEKFIPLLEKIFAAVEENPGSEQEIKRLIDRYLPMIINPAEAYQAYVQKGIAGEEMDDLRGEVINGIKLVSEACTNLLNRLFEDGIVDASTDISVLEMMLKQDGLLGSDI